MSITTAFPAPPSLVGHAFAQLVTALTGTPTQLRKLGDLADLARPWDPPSCPPTLRRALWPWLDAVAAWINRDHGWQVDRLIPACWPAHPHIARELSVVACLRYQAGQSLTPTALEDWQRITLPAFLDRIAARLGANGCPPGRHAERPAVAREQHYTTARARRAAAFAADTRPTTSSGR